jgi:hypothetical protein
MASHLRHRHALGQPQDLGIEIEMALRPACAAVQLQELAVLIRSPIVTGLNRSGCGLRRLRETSGKCEGRKSHAELRPEVVALARKLRRRSPKRGQRSLRQIAAELAAPGLR